MKKLTALLLSALLLFSLAGCASSSDSSSSSSSEELEACTLTIQAAASLKNAMADVTEAFKKEQPNVELVFNYGGSGDLQKQIENATGSEFDFFISAAQKQMNALEEEDLIVKDTREDFVENKLVLIAPKDSSDVTGIDSLTSDAVTQIAIGEPSSVPAGQYAEEAFGNLGITDAVSGKLVYGKDVTQVLTYVSQGEVQAGVVYQTDAISDDNVKIVEEFPADSYTKVVYPMAVLKMSAHQDAAKVFEEFLKTDTVKTIMEKYGFTPVD